MRGNSWLFALMLLVGLGTPNLVYGQNLNKLVGRWVASVPAEEGSYMIRDGDTIRFKGRPAYNVTLNFKSDNQGFLQWGDSAKAKFFSYRLINSKLIEFKYPSGKRWLHSVFLNGNFLSLGEYPVHKESKETILILYTLTFVKQH